MPAPVNVSNVRKGERSVTTFVDRAEIVIPTRIRKIQERHGEPRTANI
ncbi:hypothetical protein [Streptomyces hygroscopicus]|nr:hypothetical protein [Streptomyces hygroscopicus]